MILVSMFLEALLLILVNIWKLIKFLWQKLKNRFSKNKDNAIEKSIKVSSGGILPLVWMNIA